MKKYLEYSDLQSNKFWYITQQDESLTIVFGKIGTKGQTQVKTFSSPYDAEKEANKLIKSKIKKGYEEKAIPPTLEQSTCTEKTIIKMADAPKPKYHPKPIPPKDVIDDGEKKPWRDLVAFDFEELRKVPPKEVVPVKQPPKQSNTSIKKETLTKTPQEQEFDNLKILLRSYIKQGVQFDIEATFEQLKALSPSNNEFQIFIKDMLQMIFSKFMKKISPIHFDCIPYLLRIRDPEILFQEIFAQGVMKYIYDRYQTHSESIHQLAEQYLTDYPIQMVDKIVNALQSIFETTKFPENVCGFNITFDYKTLEIYALFNERNSKRYYSESLNELEYDGTSYGVEINNQYFVPLLTEKLQKMLDDGFFGDMTNKYFKIALFQTDNILIEIPLEQTYRQTKVFELERDLKYLEQSDEYYADLLTDTVEEYFAYNGIIDNYDTDRILALLKKYLYSCEKEAESEGRSLLRKYKDFDYNKWWLVYLQFEWENFSYKYAYNGVECLVDKGYEPAIIQKQAWDKLGIIDSKSEKKDDSRYQSATERFYNTFTENDVFCETDTIIARAMPTGGEIYLRFKQESEQAYSDALDYLNGIMAKGYSEIFHGHWLHIYFVAKPKYYSEFAKYVEDFEYLKDIEESELGLAIGGIVCGSHAFFRKAVMYESLHDKIREFVDLTMYQDHKSFEIQNESSVAGTFAAIALAMTDVKHMDLAIKFANEIDSYYEDLASNFGIVLEKYWGITPETAVAIALLQLSYECHTAKLSSQFYKIPQNLASLTDYYRRNEPKNPNCKLTNLVIELFDNYKPSYALKKLKKLFNNATDPQEKLIYADFHNLVIEALEEEGEVSGQPIIYNLPPKYENDSKPLTIVDQNFIENPPCVITPLEAKKRGFNIDELDSDGSSWEAFVFAPLTITNPYLFDHLIEFIKPRKKITANSSIIWGAEQAYRFGKKVVIDFSGTPYQVGMGIYGKNQAQLIYGVMDFAKIAEAMNKQAPDKEKLYALRKQHYYFDSPKGSPNIDYSKPGMMYLDEAIAAGVLKDDNYRATKQLEKITPDMGEVYDASLLFRAYMMQKKQDYAMEKLQRKLDTTELKQVYQTAQKRLPQYQEYWQEKLAKL
ncbi:WGR domain-containing protein [Gilliamella sp. ESL0441]|uniref:WGR domain-containing protein n=2 Tax=Gilliamella TaxID=1193503 RepID=UPI001C6A529F|nr:WGR domain-containing protein [Gilliamella sp. ESL0441]QYN43892.1 WGR domain-containing protein [Gilliamella sp. ESL0441]